MYNCYEKYTKLKIRLASFDSSYIHFLIASILNPHKVFATAAKSLIIKLSTIESVKCTETFYVAGIKYENGTSC